MQAAGSRRADDQGSLAAMDSEMSEWNEFIIDVNDKWRIETSIQKFQQKARIRVCLCRRRHEGLYIVHRGWRRTIAANHRDLVDTVADEVFREIATIVSKGAIQ
jgi:hypothetical protein